MSGPRVFAWGSRDSMRTTGHGPRAVFAVLVLAAGVLLAAAARAEEAPADSAMRAHMRGLSDSTDAWFGQTAVPVDTTGLDSALAAGLALPPGARRAGTRGARLSWSPALGFNRADGGQLGLGVGVHSPLPGRLTGRAQWTTGSEDVLGEAAWAHSWRVGASRARVGTRLAVGRWSEPADRDHYEPVFATLGAVLWGDDRHDYLRRDGMRASVRLGNDRWFGSIGWRDQLESSLPFTTRWTLFGHEPDPRENDPMLEGRVRELGVSASATIPGTRFRTQYSYWTSDPRLGSDHRYRRHLVVLGGDVSLGRHLALLPRASYGRLRGAIAPQQAFYFGGSPNVRTFEPEGSSGSGRTFARADLVLVDDLRTLLHLPLPAWIPLQAGAFAATGASWGRDPVTNVAVASTRDWPDRSEWLAEAGVTLSWRYGLPDPLSALRFEYALPIGPDGRGTKFKVTVSHPLGRSAEPW